MADDENTTQATPGSGDGDGPPRETTSGRYVSRHDENATGDDDKDKEKEEPEGKKRWLLLLLLLLLILLLLICAGAAYMKWWSKDDPTPTPSPTAVATTSAPKPSVSPSVTASPSLSPSPSPSATARTVAMPNVVGMPASQAKTVLESAGLTNIKFVDEAKPNDSLSILAGFVVTKQSVAAGTQVAVDTPVTITSATSSNGKG
jgi:hypothetical protein